MWFWCSILWWFDFAVFDTGCGNIFRSIMSQHHHSGVATHSAACPIGGGLES